jgi:drug/metabolite transporter (DMT)-like permease
MNVQLSRRTALAMFALVILCWGFNWTVAKLLVQSVPPLWMVAIRSAIALAALFVLLTATGNLRLPKRGDLPAVINITLLHMVAYALLMGIALQNVPAGRSIVLGFTTPLWVIPGAMLFLGERMTPLRALGVALGLGGLALMFNPLAFDWNDRRALLGNGLLLLAAFCWAMSILHLRAHRWVSSPFHLLFWEVLPATVLLSVLAYAFEGVPHFEWDTRTGWLFAYSGVFGVALAYWAMAMVNRSLPAITVSLGVLATPVVGVLVSIAFTDETFSLSLSVALAMIIGGIALGTLGGAQQARQ